MNCKLISLHDTMTVNLTLVQCKFHTGKNLSLQESNQLIGSKMPTSGFVRNIWFLIPISRRRANVRFAPLRTRHHWLFYIRFYTQGKVLEAEYFSFLSWGKCERKHDSRTIVNMAYWICSNILLNNYCFKRNDRLTRDKLSKKRKRQTLTGFEKCKHLFQA